MTPAFQRGEPWRIAFERASVLAGELKRIVGAALVNLEKELGKGLEELDQFLAREGGTKRRRDDGRDAGGQERA